MFRSAALAAVFTLVSCAPVGTGTPGAALSSTQFVKALRAGGLKVERLDTIQQPFFTPRAAVYRLNGDDLQVYEYADAATAAQEAARVSPAGAIGGSMPLWIAPPHFYRKERILAIYLGTRTEVTSTLTRTLGPQFAGR